MPVPSRPFLALPQLHAHGGAGSEEGVTSGQVGLGDLQRDPHCRDPGAPTHWLQQMQRQARSKQAGRQAGGRAGGRAASCSAHLWHIVSTPLVTPCASKALLRSLISSVASTECTRPAATSACLQWEGWGRGDMHA